MNNYFLLFKIKYIIDDVLIYSSVQISNYESIGVSTIVKRIISGFTPSGFSLLSQDIVKRFLENITYLTCKFAEGAATEENVSF